MEGAEEVTLVENLYVVVACGELADTLHVRDGVVKSIGKTPGDAVKAFFPGNSLIEEKLPDTAGDGVSLFTTKGEGDILVIDVSLLYSSKCDQPT
jgi:hypothetical protein